MSVFYNSSGKLEIKHQKKNTRQGQSKNTKLSATSANHKKKRYKGQGK